MLEVKGKYKNGIVVLDEKPEADEDTDVLVVFPNMNAAISAVSIKQYLKLSGAVSLGGNAVNECEALYE